jgi:hypothetical protein
VLDGPELLKALDHLRLGDWHAAHEIVQKDEDSPLSCWAHGIVHIMEGDIPNARYWYARAKRAFPLKVDAKSEVRALADALAAPR